MTCTRSRKSLKTNRGALDLVRKAIYLAKLLSYQVDGLIYFPGSHVPNARSKKTAYLFHQPGEGSVAATYLHCSRQSLPASIQPGPIVKAELKNANLNRFITGTSLIEERNA